MTLYYVVDCDRAIPDRKISESNKMIIRDMEKRVIETLRKELDSEYFNLNTTTRVIIVGTCGEENLAVANELLPLVVEYFNNIILGNGKSDNDIRIKGYTLLNETNGHVMAGIKTNPEIDGQIKILSSRPSTLALFQKRNKNWWFKKELVQLRGATARKRK